MTIGSVAARGANAARRRAENQLGRETRAPGPGRPAFWRVRYTHESMPLDVLAEILSNTPLAPDYNVVTFRAPQIAEAAAPGQFVMVRCAQGLDPVLRRP